MFSPCKNIVLETLLCQSLPTVTNTDTYSFQIGGTIATASPGVPNSTIEIHCLHIEDVS